MIGAHKKAENRKSYQQTADGADRMHRVCPAGGRTMEKTWDTFFATGRVDDYLDICRERKSLAESTAGEKTEQETKQNGRKPCGDRNGLKCNANWRV